MNLYFTLLEQDGPRQYFYVGMSSSRDLNHWTEPMILTERNPALDYSSPGSILKKGDTFYLCVQSYCRPHGEIYGNNDCRIFFMKSKDLLHWSAPELIRVKGGVPRASMGRMIDPFVLEDRDEPGKYWCFYKQNGVSFSYSHNLQDWTFAGRTDCGENVCVIPRNGFYYLMHSPENGLGLLRTKDFQHFESLGTTFLRQSQWPWAKDRLTAGFVLDLTEVENMGCYLLFFHGDNEDAYPFGATLAMAYGYDLQNWNYFD